MNFLSRCLCICHLNGLLGRDAKYKLAKVREWIREQPPTVSSYSKAEPTLAQTHVATLVTSLSCIGLLVYHFHNRVLIITFPAYTLNLRGSDIPYNPLFHSYLFISLDKSYLFVESAKLHPDVIAYLNAIDVEQRNYTDLWPFLRRRLWGEGKVLIAPQTSYAISLMLTHVRYTVAPSCIEMMMSVKNETEIEGMKRAYLRDGVSYVRFFSCSHYF